MTDAARTASPTDPADAGLHTVPDEIWDQVRDDYLSGWSAPACCRRYGVGLSTLRKRAAGEGWRRADRPWSPPNGLEHDDEGLTLEEQFDGDLDQIPLGELALVAFQRMMRAVLHGKAMEALRWRRVYTMLQAETVEIERRRRAAEVERLKANSRHSKAFADAVLQGARADYAAALMETDDAGPIDDIDGIDGIDGVFSPSPGAPPSPRILPGLPGGAPFMGPP
ncbi:hypothetical protein [Brevundimonas sp. GCM10030266]|uniref:hypothetical protein n=1 Tax=Brevundimonas sp. GCM10030266 TaxID=3273386 RepID=UPI00361D764F